MDDFGFAVVARLSGLAQIGEAASASIRISILRYRVAHRRRGAGGVVSGEGLERRRPTPGDPGVGVLTTRVCLFLGPGGASAALMGICLFCFWDHGFVPTTGRGFMQVVIQ
ncbi:hypothetical protein EJ06DRAFT_340134 [Trichodelitschia bisporula]|uniref:Uncharacterized protein n=1 Tax=Trichodelitschia bisporula TaxID=703511 RepID=A0A6G1I2G7_9PEZI|nr:hypothetical protein EJ06DRAFT_340134 [Trichodelitschia bisporula]